jgi:subtilase-type serine protease
MLFNCARHVLILFLSSVAIVVTGGALLPSEASAACTPAAGPGMPLPGTVVVCTGNTSNQNSPHGYGDGTQNGLTINVQSGAVLTSTNGSGLFVNNQNFVGNSGTISSVGGTNTIDSIGDLTINNSGSITNNGVLAVHSNTGAINLTNSGSITGFFHGVLTDGPVVVNNTGTIIGGSGPFAMGIRASTVDVTNTGTISAGVAITALAGGSKVVNSGTINGLGGPAIILRDDSNVVINAATGVLNGSISNVIGSAASITINNAGAIAASPTSVNAIGAVQLALTNSGSITGNSTAISASTAVITNSGTISANTFGITANGGGSIITNSGTITATSRAITFVGGLNTLTLTPTSTINGVVLAGPTDKLSLGGIGAGSFDVNNIGPTAQYRNFGSFSKVGDSTWTLTGSGTQNWAVQSGTLLVNGNAGATTVAATGTLGGNGTVGATTINGGTLSPGNSIGTITVSGILGFSLTGNYIVEVSPASADRTNASGLATISGTLHAVGLGGTYVVGTKYTVINAPGVVGTFSSLDVTGSFGATRPHIEYDLNNVYLVLGQGTISPFLVGGTPNQRAVAGAIDTALLAGSQAAPFLALFNLSSTQLPAALDQLSGEVHASTVGVLVDESRYMRQAVLGRLQQASYGPDMGAMAALSIGGPQAAFADGTELTSALAYAKSPIVTKGPPMVAPNRDVVFWAQGFGAWGRFETDGNVTTVRRDLAGFISGVDTRVGDAGRLGVAAGYTSSHNVLDGRGTANVETGHIAAYGGWRFGSINLRAGGAYAWHTIDTDRSIAFPGFFDRATAHYDGGTGQVFGELGYGFALGNIAVEPFAGGAWARLNTDAAAERGGLAALNVAGTTFEVGYSTVGIRAASMIPIAHDMMLIPRGTLAWQHAFDSVTPTATLAFQAAPVPFVIAGVPIARDALLAEAGLDLAIGRHATLGVSYVGQLAGNVQDHAAKGKFSWKF